MFKNDLIVPVVAAGGVAAIGGGVVVVVVGGIAAVACAIICNGCMLRVILQFPQILHTYMMTDVLSNSPEFSPKNISLTTVRSFDLSILLCIVK